LFAGALGFGLLTGKNYLQKALGEALQLTNEGWRKLTLRWIGFFVAMAALNEVVWRTLSESSWVTFKLFGILPLTVLFMVAQIGLIKRNSVEKTQT
jgi:intracellular septation protein